MLKEIRVVEGNKTQLTSLSSLWISRVSDIQKELLEMKEIQGRKLKLQ